MLVQACAVVQSGSTGVGLGDLFSHVGLVLNLPYTLHRPHL